MQSPGPMAETPPTGEQPSSESRWSLAFVGIVGYLLVEYMRLPLQYPPLRVFQIGKIVVAMALLGWLLSPRQPSGDRSPIRAIDIAMGSLLFAALFSMLFANYIDLAWEGYIDLLKWALISFLIGRIVTSSWRLRIFTFLLILLNLKLAQAGIRYFYHSRAAWDEAAAVREGARAGTGGFFSNSSDLGVAMCVVWPLAVMLLFAKHKIHWRVLLLTSSGVFLVAILVSGSRGALVGAVCALLAGLIYGKRKVAAILMILLLLPGVLYVLPGASKERFKSAMDPGRDMTASSRLVFWRAGLRMFADHPLLGVGIKNFPVTRLQKYADLGFTARAWVPHSIYIEVLAELGASGFISAVALFVLFFRLNAKTRRHLLKRGPEQRKSFEYCLASGLDLALVGYMSSGAFVAVFYYPHLWVLLGLSVGLYTACMRIQNQTAPQEAVHVEPSGQPHLVAS